MEDQPVHVRAGRWLGENRGVLYALAWLPAAVVLFLAEQVSRALIQFGRILDPWRGTVAMYRAWGVVDAGVIRLAELRGPVAFRYLRADCALNECSSPHDLPPDDHARMVPDGDPELARLAAIDDGAPDVLEVAAPACAAKCWPRVRAATLAAACDACRPYLDRMLGDGAETDWRDIVQP